MTACTQPSIATSSRRRRSRRLAIAVGLLLALGGGAASADTIRIGLRVIADGDTSGKVLEVAGQPDSKTHAKAARSHAKGGKKKSGAASGGGDKAGDGGERWTYHRDGKTIVFVIAEGRVVSISERRN